MARKALLGAEVGTAGAGVVAGGAGAVLVVVPPGFGLWNCILYCILPSSSPSSPSSVYSSLSVSSSVVNSRGGCSLNILVMSSGFTASTNPISQPASSIEHETTEGGGGGGGDEETDLEAWNTRCRYLLHAGVGAESGERRRRRCLAIAGRRHLRAST
jgi:hypothetical protein